MENNITNKTNNWKAKMSSSNVTYYSNIYLTSFLFFPHIQFSL